MPILKPTRGLQLNKSHPLAHGLAGCWLFNESSGGTVFDPSGNQNLGTLYGDASWTDGKFGSALNFDGSGDYVQVPYSNILNPATFTISAWAKVDGGQGTWRSVITSRHSVPCRGYIIYGSAENDWQFWIGDGSSSWIQLYGNPIILGKWTHLVAIYNNPQMLFYIDGVLVGSNNHSFEANISNPLRIGAGVTESGPDYFFNGKIDNVGVYSRALSAAEVVLLYREPFCIFKDVISPAFLFVPTINLVGTSSAQSLATATAKRIRRIRGSSAAVANVTALLKIIGEILLAGSTGTSSVASGKLTLNYRGPWLISPLKIERPWLTDALFNGMTANAFKLGTVLTGGWFWMRPTGCSVLYRGPSMEQIDFANILAVVKQDAGSFSPAEYIPHDNDSVYFYVVRQFNICGYQERTLQAAIKVSIDDQGGLAKPKTNNIFAARADQIDGNKVQLTWFYCPLEQKSKPTCFKVYYDGGTGQIDYENPIGEISYRGRKFYGYRSHALPADRYLFAIITKDVDGVENGSLARLGIQLSTQSPDQINILNVKII